MSQKIILLVILFALTGNVFAQSYDTGCYRGSDCPVLPVIEFKNTVFLSKRGKLQLDSAVKIANHYPMCRIKVIGNGTSSQESQQHSWDKAASVIMYLKKKGVKKERLILIYGEDGNPDLVSLIGTDFHDALTPSWTALPPPHPELSLHSRKAIDFFTREYNFHNSP